MKSLDVLVLLACLLAVALAADRYRREDDNDNDEEDDEDEELIIDGGGSSVELAQSKRPKNSSQIAKKKNSEKPCCTIPKMADEEMMSSIKECRNGTTKDQTKVKRTKGNRPRCWKRLNGCFAECIYKKSDLLTTENKIDHAKVKDRIIKFLDENNQTSWKTHAEKAMESCSNAGDKIPAQQKCKSGSLELAVCFRNHLFLMRNAEQGRNVFRATTEGQFGDAFQTVLQEPDTDI